MCQHLSIERTELSGATGRFVLDNTVAQRMKGVEKTPPRNRVLNQPGIQGSVAVSKGEWRITPPSCARYAYPTTDLHRPLHDVGAGLFGIHPVSQALCY
jgi:hypothetical protein